MKLRLAAIGLAGVLAVAAVGGLALAKKKKHRAAPRGPYPEPRLVPGLSRPLGRRRRAVARRRAAWNQDISRRRSTRTPPRSSPTSTPTAATTCTPTSARRATTASPTRSSAAGQRKLPSPLHRLRRRERPRPVPGPARRAGRGRRRARRRPPRARRRPRRCKLYELYRAFPKRGGSAPGTPTRARSGTCARPPCGPTAGPRPTPPGCRSSPAWSATTRSPPGRVDHAIRVTFDSTRDAWIHPASHCAGDTSNPNAPPMGMRLRLRAGYDLGGFSGDGEGDRRGAEALRDDRRRQRLELVLQRQQRPPLGRRQPQPAEADSRLAFEVVRSQADVHAC